MSEEKKIVVRVHKHRQPVANEDYDKLMFVSEYYQRHPSDIIRRLIRKEYDQIKNQTFPDSGLSSK